MNKLNRFEDFVNEGDNLDNLEKKVRGANEYLFKVQEFLKKKGETIAKASHANLDEDGSITFKNEPYVSVSVTSDSMVYVTVEHPNGFRLMDETDNLETMYADLKKAKNDKTKGKYKAKPQDKEKEKPWVERDDIKLKDFAVYSNDGNSMKFENKKNGKSVTVGLYAWKDVLNALTELF